jgi:hypothetical protein
VAQLFLDNDFPLDAADGLRLLGHDVETARSTQREDQTDDAQLLYAANGARILVSHNWKDYLLLHDAWHRWSKDWGTQRLHAGILILRQRRKYQGFPNDIHTLLVQSGSIVNQLYRCDTRGHWSQYPDP